MASTEAHRLGPEHLAGCLALSSAANWNQNDADWRCMLEMGRGWGISLADGTLIASTLVLPYGSFAWISMVLVLPEHRRKGHATGLLRLALADLEDRRLAAVLDATPAGREVYRREGFVDCWGFSRLTLRGGFREIEAGSTVRPLRNADWRWILELDSAAFGARREALLRSLAARLPQAALVVEEEGFILGRDGREAAQLGPLVARDERTAQRLLAGALRAVPGPLYLDVVAPSVQRWLEGGGFSFQRPYTRMARGIERAPGIPSGLFLVAGPELG